MPLPPAAEIWSSIPVPAFLIETNGKTLSANPAAEEFMNASVKTLIGQPLFDRLAVDAPLRARPLVMRFEEIWATGEPGLNASVLGL